MASMKRKNGGSNRYSNKDEIETYSDSETSDSKCSEFLNCDTDEDGKYVSQPKMNRKSGKRLQTQNGGISFRYNRNSTSSIEEHRLERLPTRRPDPKVFNRNALLARENRRRKKEEMEIKEQKFDKIKCENKNMKKLMKQQEQIIKKLTNEKLYLRSIISNHTEILTLLKTIRPTNPITSSAFNYAINNNATKINARSDSIVTTQSSSPSSYEEENDYDFGYSTSLPTESFSFSDSLDDYENLLSDNYKISDIKNETDDDNVRSEHNYHSKLKNTQQDSGVCLHVSSGRVSLEFCSACHSNAQDAWIEG